MKKILLLILIFVSQITFSQTKITDNQKIESLILVWGLLKYYHPEVSTGKFDFNLEFLKEYNKMQTIDNQEDLNSELINWIKKFETKKTKFKLDENFLKSKNIFIKNVDFKWIENSNFNTELIAILNKLKNNTAFGNYYASVNSLSKMVGFKTEKALENFDSTNQSNRVLFLSSFWNIMRYWNVNIYLTEQPWSEVLTEMIPEFSKNDRVDFELAKEKLFSKLNDSHSDYGYSTTLNTVKNFPAFGGRIINDSLVINIIYNKTQVEKDAIEIGDVIYAIEGVKLKDYYLSKYKDVISTSNENYLKYAIEKTYLLASDNDSIRVELLKKDGTRENKHIQLAPLSYFAERYTRLRPSILEKNWGKIHDDIGYLNLYKITKQELKTAFKSFENSKGIIIDLRNYPSHIHGAMLADYLYPNKKKYMTVLGPSSPAYGEYNFESPLKLIKDPFAAGKKNSKYYKGKIVLLVDRKTASKAEHMAMIIQQSPNCITVGEQTFGAVMNRNEVILMDKTTIDFTGMGAFYPNDLGVQIHGVKIDYEVKESAKNYNLNHYVEEAIKIINQ